MFNKKEALFGGDERLDTIIGKDTSFKGSLQAGGTLRIDGYFEGEITTKGNIVVGENGVIKATIKGRNCTVAGEVNGDISAEQKLEIVSSGKVNGNIQCENLIIGEGAVFHGTCEMPRGGAGEKAADVE